MRRGLIKHEGRFQVKRAALQIVAALAFGAVVATPPVCAAHGTDANSSKPLAIFIKQSVSSASVAGPGLPVFGCTVGAAPSTGDVSAPASALPLGLTMADFTGDGHPDVATLEFDRLDSSTAQYSIEVQLSEGGRQSLRLTGPPGGLFITPRDVTGDGTLDLVVRSVGSQLPVGVFLNDGCGHFAAKAPTRFAGTIQDVPMGPEFDAQPQCFAAVAIALGPHAVECQDRSRRPLQEHGSSLLSTNDGAPSQLFSSFGNNRAPPAIE